ncbi:GW dipeptide domain-containing protein [Aestuariirhabdus litorea]|uniref:GW domain-containing protein n=1 Tax=Aestuariirhabdus litorea TaxID=2528527 RepID=A0A3P3VUH7_9GAMM|nr:GW dipeptide domain-containing protein [Aestuariirhabdus litorea]RRJ85276.1 hypothetical protein D0544_09500 [Aestuariirhabdus litorea]RWW98497.1 hypothetical protein DZC74_09485 [Endozoicomonadaceae bacterium GTF-13]
MIKTSYIFIAAAAAWFATTAVIDTTPAPSHETAAHPSTAAAAHPALPAGFNQGTVVEALNAGGYTYAQVNTNGQQLWIAGPQTAVQAGQNISWGQGAVMTNFTSKSLGRTFDQILFVSSYMTDEQLAAREASTSRGKVLAVQEAGGYSYMEVDTGAKTVWVAAPAIQVKVNDTVQWGSASEMHNFTSKSLARTFDSILFAAAVSVAN